MEWAEQTEPFSCGNMGSRPLIRWSNHLFRRESTAAIRFTSRVLLYLWISTKERPMLLHTGIDQIDRKILRELTNDARLTVAELGRRISLSPSATAERLRRLESLEFIRGYRADINLHALGFTITAF